MISWSRKILRICFRSIFFFNFTYVAFLPRKAAWVVYYITPITYSAAKERLILLVIIYAISWTPETGQDFIYLYCSWFGSVYLTIESVHGRTATRCKFLKKQHKATRKSNSKGNNNSFSQFFGEKMWKTQPPKIVSKFVERFRISWNVYPENCGLFSRTLEKYIFFAISTSIISSICLYFSL